MDYTGKNPELPAASKDVNEYQLINLNLSSPDSVRRNISLKNM